MRLLILLLFLSAFAMSTPARGQMVFGYDLNLDLTKPADQNKVLVFNTDLDLTPHPFSITEKGIGLSDIPSQVIQEISIETTTPIPIGLAWRTADSVYIIAKIKASQPMPNWNGVTHLYLRYSPDDKHWSDWQTIHQTNANTKPGTELIFVGDPAVPSLARLPYVLLLTQRRKITGVNDDEEGDVRWILNHNPRFFENCLPFMGYIQFLFEADIESGQRIQSIDIGYDWGVGGMSQGPGRKTTAKEQADREGFWHFKG